MSLLSLLVILIFLDMFLPRSCIRLNGPNHLVQECSSVCQNAARLEVVLPAALFVQLTVHFKHFGFVPLLKFMVLRVSYKDHVTNEEVCAKIQQAIGPHEDILTIVKRR